MKNNKCRNEVCQYFWKSFRASVGVFSRIQQISGVEKSGVRQKSVKELDFWSLFFNSDYSLCYGILPGGVLFWSSLIGVQERVLTPHLGLNVEKCATTLVLQHKGYFVVR